MNEAVLTGYLARGIEIEEVGRRHVVGRVLLAVPRSGRDGDGQIGRRGAAGVERSAVGPGWPAQRRGGRRDRAPAGR
jgi:hypothetical protein